MKPFALNGAEKSETVILLLCVVPFLDYVSSAVLFLAVAGAIVFDKRSVKIVLSGRKSCGLCCLIPAFSMLSAAFAGNLIGISVSIGILCFFTIALYLKETVTPKSFQKATVIISIGSVISMLSALFQKYVIFPEGELYRPTAGAFNANYFGAIAVMTALIASVRISKGRKQEKLYWMLILMANSVSLFLSESRSALLSLSVCIIVFSLLKKRFALCGLAVGCGVALWIAGWMRPELFSWTNSLSYIFSERMMIWESALKSFSQNAYTAFVGRGPMTYYFVMDKEGLYAANHAHNLLIDTLINVGLIGTALYAILAVKLINFVVQKRKAGDSDGYILSVLIITQILAQGLADVTIMWHQCASLAALIMTSKCNENE